MLKSIDCITKTSEFVEKTFDFKLWNVKTSKEKTSESATHVFFNAHELLFKYNQAPNLFYFGGEKSYNVNILVGYDFAKIIWDFVKEQAAKYKKAKKMYFVFCDSGDELVKTYIDEKTGGVKYGTLPDGRDERCYFLNGEYVDINEKNWGAKNIRDNYNRKYGKEVNIADEWDFQRFKSERDDDFSLTQFISAYPLL